MSKSSTAVAAIAIAAGVFALLAVPVVRLDVLVARMGLPALTALMFVEGAVALARTLSPLRGTAWFKRAEADRPGLAAKVVVSELALAAFAVTALAITATWWQPLVGIAPPIWMIALIALRYAGLMSLTVLATLRRPLAAFVALFDLALVLPIVALFSGSLASVVITSASITWVLTLLVALTPVMQPSDEKPQSTDRWRLGSWLGSIAESLRRPLIAVFAGLAAVVPFSAALIVSSLLMLPFHATAVTKQSPSIALRALRGIALAGIGFLVIHQIGPSLYRAVFPAELGDGRWLELLAWTSLASIPMSLRPEPKPESTQLRIGLAAVISGGLMIGLGIVHGTPGFLVGVALGATVTGVVAMKSKLSNPVLSDGP